MLGTGLGFFFFSSFAVLLVVAVLGTLNPSTGDVSVFLPAEQALLAALPSALHAQLQTSVSVAGGLSVPVSSLGDRVDAGYNVAGALTFGAPLIPLGLRVEAAYNAFNGKSQALTTYTNTQIISGTVNATLALGPTGASPYLIGGVGAYNRRFSADAGTSSDRTTGGFNVGAGVRFPLGTMSTFVEARYHQMLGNPGDFTDYRYIPVTFGISF